MSDAVLNLLNNQKLAFTVSGRDYLIRCLNPKHDDSSPSLRIDKLTGIAHCFACGWKRNLFRHYGILTTPIPVKVSKLKAKLLELATVSEVSLPEDSYPYTKVFRGISVSTLKKFEAFYTTGEEKLEDRVCFPIRDITGKCVVLLGRHVLSNAEKRYEIFPSGRPVPCYPMIFEEATTSAVLVEGIFDMLNLYDKGIKNVVCCFGTNTLKKEAKYMLLPLKAQGIHKLYLMFDGDDAGRNSMKELTPILEDLGFQVYILELEDELDPGNLNQSQVDIYKKYIHENSNN
jgi:DNA primase